LAAFDKDIHRSPFFSGFVLKLPLQVRELLSDGSDTLAREKKFSYPSFEC